MRLLHFDYGQKAREQEWAATKAIALALNGWDIARSPNERLGLTVVKRIPLDFFKDNIPSPLTSGTIETSPQYGVAHEWVPARNTVFVALALAYAEAGKFSRIVVGINESAAEAYSDNSRGWLDAYQRLIGYATRAPIELYAPVPIELYAPLVTFTKGEIVKYGEDAGVPWDTDTWSCYAGGKLQCGLCSSCRARKDAFKFAGVEDPTEYAE
jgi:7-cyano-7-deazaguanine synthase